MNKIKISIPFLLILIVISQAGKCQPNREQWQPPEKIMEAIGVKEGMVIGEIGAGRGYMTFPLVEKVGPGGMVYANDISSWSLRSLRNRKERDNLETLEVIEGKVDDPEFPVNNLDLMIMVYVFHDLSQPVVFTRNTLKYLKDDGTLVLVEKDIVKDPSGAGHFLPREEILGLMAQTGYKLKKIETFLKNDNIYIFGKE